jgi:carbonic anhydrase
LDQFIRERYFVGCEDIDLVVAVPGGSLMDRRSWFRTTLGLESLERQGDIAANVRLLPKTIEKLFGKLSRYSVDQVLAAIEHARLGTEVQYGLAMYCTQQEFERYFAQHDIYFDYQQLRKEISKYQSGLDLDAVKEGRALTANEVVVEKKKKPVESLDEAHQIVPAPDGSAAADRVLRFRQMQSGRTEPLAHDPIQVVRDLKAGNRRFMDGISYQSTRSSLRKLKEYALTEQYPKAILLCCSDSRAPVEIIFDQDIGDLFVIRVAGNIVAPSLVGSIEFAVETFGTNVVIVMGHSRCGAVTAALDHIEKHKETSSTNIQDIVGRIVPNITLIAATESLSYEEKLSCSITQNVKTSIEQLSHSSEFIDSLIKQQMIQVHGAVLDLATGEVQFLEGQG